MTYTYALLDVSPACWQEIHDKLKTAGYENQFHDRGGWVVIDLHGIGLVTVAPMVIRDPDAPDTLAPLAPATGEWMDLTTVDVTDTGVLLDGALYSLTAAVDLHELYVAEMDGPARYRVWRFGGLDGHEPWRAERIGDDGGVPMPRVLPSSLEERARHAEWWARVQRLTSS